MEQMVDKTKMEQMMERLLAEMKADKAEMMAKMDATEHKRDADIRIDG
jgi:hypothetical protein